MVEETEITTLPGGQNLGELADIEYFQKKLYRALGVPESRIAADGGFNLVALQKFFVMNLNFLSLLED